MRRPNHASRFEGIAKTKLQASRASDTETLQSQVNKAAEKRLSLSGLEILHGRQLVGGHLAEEPRSLGGGSLLPRSRQSLQEPLCHEVVVHRPAAAPQRGRNAWGPPPPILDAHVRGA